MYIPAWFREDNPAVLHELMRQYSFATLVTVTNTDPFGTEQPSPFATHLPVLLDAECGTHGTLRAHIARANPQWQHFEAGKEALVLFQGPHAFISPTWYETWPNVPTWNYAVVHAYGTPRILNDDELYSLLMEMVATFDANPKAQELPEEFVRRLQKGVVGFEIEIARLEGKLKMSQNRPGTDLERVIAVLRQSANPTERELAEEMQRLLPGVKT